MAVNEKLLSIKIQTEAETKTIAGLQKNLVLLTKQRNELNKKIRDGIGLTKDEERKLGELQSELVGTRNKLRDMEREVVKNNDALKKNSGFVAGVRKGITEFTTSIGGALLAFAALGKVVSNVSKIVADFDQSQANLRATTSKTKDELALLTEQAKILGSTTAFTATQVTDAQTELAKLGFTVSEITQLTPAVLDLASATGTDIANAATIAGSTVRGFGLDASQTQRVVDVMANSFTKSSLDIQKFSDGMAKVAPVAKNAGLTIEETTAMLGILTDNGIAASTAGLGLKNVFLEVTKRGITLEDALSQIQNSTDKNKTSLELFGKENATVGVLLAENTEKSKMFADELLNSAGVAERMANEQLNTLKGSLTQLSSAWEGLVLSFESGEGPIGSTIKSVTDYFTKLLNVLTLWNEGEISFFDTLTKEEIDAKLKAREDRLAKEAAAIEETNKAKEENKKVTNEVVEVKEKEVAKTKDLIKLKQEELKTIQNGEATTENEIAQRNRKVQILKDEIAAMQELGIKREEELEKMKVIDSIETEIELQQQDRELALKSENQLKWEEETAMKSDKVQKDSARKQMLVDKQKRETLIASINAVGQVANETQALISQNYESARLAEVAAAEGNNEKIAQINKKYAKKQQNLSAIQAAINGALAITSALATVQPTVPAGIIAASAAAATSAVQIAAIKSQKFQKGGLLQGKSHAEGGIPFSVGGKVGFEAEGGEAIINKKSTAMFAPLLSAINQAGGGVAFANGGRVFASGGVPVSTRQGAVTSSTFSDGMNNLGDMMSNVMSRIEVVNVATNTTEVATEVQNIQSEASF